MRKFIMTHVTANRRAKSNFLRGFRHQQSLLPLAILAGLVTNLADAGGGSTPSSSEKEAVVLVVSKWNGDCDASNRTSWDNMLDAWYDDITDSGSTPGGHSSKAYVADNFRKNDGVSDDDFCDEDVVDWGADTGEGDVDEGDAVMIGLHGSEGSTTSDWYGSMHTDCSGTDGSDCNCTAAQQEMRLGDADCEFLHLSSCFSLDDEDWDDWEVTFEGLHQVNGFAGIMWISTTYNGDYKGFSDDSFDIAIAEAWLDNHYSDGFWTGGNDHCPVSMAAGLSESDVENRIADEEYDYVFSDPDNPTDFCVIWIGGCDAKDESPLPTCGGAWECDDTNP